MTLIDFEAERNKRLPGDEFGLLVSFPDQSETFVLGFEAGQIWTSLSALDEIEDRVVHAKNNEVIQRMCEALGFDCSLEPLANPDGHEGMETYLTLTAWEADQ